MKRLILHIGTGKTGTTAIQFFLFKNRVQLEAGGFGIPVQAGAFRRKDGRFFGEYRNGHWLIPLALSQAPLQLPKRAAHLTSENLKAASHNAELFRKAVFRHDTIVLSDESLARLSSSRSDFIFSLKTVLHEFGATRIKIIVYLRRQDQLVTSRWLQSVKSRNYSSPSQEFIRDPIITKFLDYNTWITNWEQTFGLENVMVRRYDRSLFPGGDICRDFCEAAGIPWREDFYVPKITNPSISLDVAEVKRLTNASPTYQNSGNFLKASALRVSKIFPDPPGTSLFSPEEASALLARHAEGNRAIAERHFGGEPLFNEDVSGLVKWRRDEGRLLNAAIALFADALAERRSPTLSRCAGWLAERLPASVLLTLQQRLPAPVLRALKR